MGDRIKEIPNQLLEFWNKYTSKQKTLIISIIAIVIVALFILGYVISRPDWQMLGRYSDPKEAATVKTLLEDNSYRYSLSKDGLSISVDAKNLSSALLLLGENDIPNVGIMSKEDLYTNSMSTTDSDRKVKTKLYYEDVLSTTLANITGVVSSTVVLTLSDQTKSVLDRDKEPYASILLQTDNEFSNSSVVAIANLVAASIGTTSLSNIRIIDQKGGLLFDGGNELGSGQNVGSIIEFKSQVRKQASSDALAILLKAGLCQDGEIIVNYDFDMDNVEVIYKEYSAPEGREEGMKTSDYNYNNQSNSGTDGVPGTDSNDAETDYMLEDSGGASGSTDITKNMYSPNEKLTTTMKEQGAINYDVSTVAASLVRYVIIREEDLEENGDLDDITFEQYQSSYVPAPPQDITDEKVADIVQLIANATGIPNANVKIYVTEMPIFESKIITPIPWSTYIPIVLLVLIAGLLAFVVFMGTAPVEVTELEPELSVEQLLATTKENQSLDDIEFSEKSESRKMIEKFVDENPAAVAQLLRNWLNEDWEG